MDFVRRIYRALGPILYPVRPWFLEQEEPLRRGQPEKARPGPCRQRTHPLPDIGPSSAPGTLQQFINGKFGDVVYGETGLAHHAIQWTVGHESDALVGVPSTGQTKVHGGSWNR